MNKALQRPVDGWPRIGPITKDELTMIALVLKKYYSMNASHMKSLLQRVVRDQAVGPTASFLLSRLPADFDRCVTRCLCLFAIHRGCSLLKITRVYVDFLLRSDLARCLC